MSMSTSRDCGPPILGRTHVENDVLSRETPIGSGCCRTRAPIRSAHVFAAMLALGIAEAGAANTTINNETVDINTPQDFGPSEVDIGVGHFGTLNVTGPGGVVASTGGWHVGGSSDGAIGTLNITAGGSVTTGDPFIIGQAAKADGIVLISDENSKLTVNGLVKITDHDLAVGTLTIENGGELQAQQIVSGGGAATLLLNGGTVTPMQNSNDFINLPNGIQLGQGAGIINTPSGINIAISSAFTNAPEVFPVTDVGSLIKVGEGTLTLNAENTFTGGMFIRGGTLIAAVPGALGAGDVFLQRGTLATASFVPLGVPTPAGLMTGKPSTINVARNYLQTGGTLGLGLASTTSYDRVNVAGSIALGGVLFVQPLGTFQPAAGNAFALIRHTTPTSERTVSGFFTEVDETNLSTLGLRPVLVYARNGVILLYLRPTQQFESPTIAKETEGIEQKEPETALEPLPTQPKQPAAPIPPPIPTATPVPTPTPPGQSSTPPTDDKPPVVVPSPTPLPHGSSREQIEEHAEQQRVIQLLSNALLPQLGPNDPVPASFLVRIFDPTVEELTSLYQTGFSSAVIQNSILNDHMGQIQRAYIPPPLPPPPPVTTKEGKEVAPPPPPPPSTPCWSIWGSAYGNWVTIDGTSSALGYNFTTAGMAAGVDYLITPHFLLGAFGGYSHDWVNFNPSGSATADEGHGGIYASYWNPTGWYINSAVYGGGASYSTNRAAAFGPASGSSSGYQFSTFGESGFNFHSNPLGNELVWGPFVGLSYTQVHINGEDEHGFLVPLNVHADTFESLVSSVGAQAYWTLHAGKFLFTPGLKLGWGHEYKYSVLSIHASAPALGGATAVFPAPNIGHDWLSIEAGLGWQITPRISAIINYEGQLAREHSTSNGVTGTFSFSF